MFECRYGTEKFGLKLKHIKLKCVAVVTRCRWFVICTASGWIIIVDAIFAASSSSSFAIDAAAYGVGVAVVVAILQFFIFVFLNILSESRSNICSLLLCFVRRCNTIEK